ncbi:leukocyte immunoglobulin-like receptor subfamily A member 6 [Phyllostomus discolor]|uniref:Leukocyte immunoglobulin-like receptor subfamily A member 6 n=1 Tax=Phyllostomus discolor TaxID=89673 RepID=A0A7E6CPK4_9CHIR|nr:leukocyte immunoglobulin-like receptor subfamily A member 6 [Phyllostomus discolor]
MSGPFHLLKEGGAELLQHRKSEQRSCDGSWQAVFPVGPMSSSHGGTYRCYGSSSSNPNVWSQPSTPLYLEVTGVYREPSLSVQPGPLVLLGGSLTLQCHSEPGFDTFTLTKDQGPTPPPQHLHGQHSPNFSLGPVNLSHGGRYRCYSGRNHSYVWSAPSAPLDILITGMSWKPSLSAQPGPLVPWGANMTLQCGSVRADTFHLHRERSLDPSQQLHLQDTAAPSQANFTISPVTLGHNGTYSCYTSHSSSPFQLSQPVTPWSSWFQDYTVANLIQLGVSGLILVVLGVLLFEAWHSRRRPHDAASS